MNELKGFSVKMRLNILVMVSFIPFTLMIIFLLWMVYSFSQRYDSRVENITRANVYTADFKESIDYTMYIIVANSERADELVDREEPYRLIEDARDTFRQLNAAARNEDTRNRLKRIIASLNSLEQQVGELEKSARVIGSYEKNMERLDLDIRVMTELIQEQVQEYIYYEAASLAVIREGIRADVGNVILISGLVLAALLALYLLVSGVITASITKPLQKLREATRLAGRGDFAVRAPEYEGTAAVPALAGQKDELAVLNVSFNQMMERIGNLVEDIRVEQLKLRAAELNLLQAQINPHFLYNTLDAIIWMAESGQTEQVITMVSALSDFFRTTLSKGRDFITVREEETHIESYLKIQQFRYRDILEYSIDIPEELYGCQVLKLTLQPVVENALYHGIKSKRGMGHIAVKGRRLGNLLLLTVEDDGMGMTEERLEAVRRGLSKETDSGDGDGFGLYNIQQRIKLYYGQEYGMEIDSQYGKGTRVEITIPVKKP